MDAFVKAEVYEHEVYLTTATGEVFRLWFGCGDPHPLMQRLAPVEITDTLEVLRRRYAERNAVG